MVVASGGWGRNASSPAGQNNNNSVNSSSPQNNNNNNSNNNNNNGCKMTAKGVLMCRDNSHPFQDRTLSLDQPVKIGRSVARARAANNNAIFDCKVLSRNHALLWYSAGKFYLQDTRSSNGTFVNNQRLSSSGLESTPKEVCSGDIVQFGVDVVESTKKVTHGCIVATLKLYLPDGKEAKASLSTLVASPASNVSLEDLYKLNQVMQEASRREKTLFSKMGYLQQLMESAAKSASQSWEALIAEDRLLSCVATLESQLAVYSSSYTEDNIRIDMVKMHEEKAQYQNTAKRELKKIIDEKLQAVERMMQLENRLGETEEECQNMHHVAKCRQTELEELSVKYTDLEKKLQETTNKLVETEETMKEYIQTAEQEKQDFLQKLEDHERIEKCLHVRLAESRFDSVNVYKQVTALRNYLQHMQDSISKLVSDRVFDSKDEENLTEVIDKIINQLNAIQVDNIEIDIEANSNILKSEQDCTNNSQEVNANQLKTSDLFNSLSKDQIDVSMEKEEGINKYILPPVSRHTLVNGNDTMSETDSNADTENSETTEEACSITSNDISEKSVIELKKEDIPEPLMETCVSHKMEVRFASAQNGETLEVHYDPLNVEIREEKKSEEISADAIDVQSRDAKEAKSIDDDHLNSEYIKTLKPSPKHENESAHNRVYMLQAFVETLDSLKAGDDLDSQEVVKKELEQLRHWLVNEPSDTVFNKLKELYYGSKNETQRIQEVNEELVILKEKCNALIEEKTEMSKNYSAMKIRCDDLVNSPYTIPLHYVAPIALALLWILWNKLF